MMGIYLTAKSNLNYNATYFHQMLLRDRGVLTAKKLVNAAEQSDGYTNLYLKGRLDLTVEALIVDNPRWQALFSENDVANARKRLDKNNYVPKSTTRI